MLFKGVVKNRMQSESYRDMQCVVYDVHRVFDHAMRGDRQQVKTLKREFDFQVKKIMAEIHETNCKIEMVRTFYNDFNENDVKYPCWYVLELLTAIRTYATYVERVNWTLNLQYTIAVVPVGRRYGAMHGSTAMMRRLTIGGATAADKVQM